MRFRLVILAVIVACKRDASVTTTSTTSTTIAPSASVSTKREPDPTNDARIVLKRWNDAHNTHDSKALEALYADDVRFYGAFLPRAACAKRKAAAFAKSPDYAQAIRDTSFVSQDGGYLVRFTKTSTSSGKSTDYPSFIVAVGGRVTEESDKLTDEHVQRARMATDDWCRDADGMPNDAIKPPFTISALDAMGRVLRSHHADDLRKTVPMLGNDTNMSCPTQCVAGDPSTCGLSFRLFDMAHVGIATSTTIEQVEVDAVKGVMWWSDGDNHWSSEALPAKP